MKKGKLLLIPACLLVLAGCQNSTPPPSGNDDKEIIDKMFKAIKGTNFTYETYSRTYTYPVDGERFGEGTEIQERFFTRTRLTEDKYHLKSVYADNTGAPTEYVSSEIRFEEDKDNGNMVYRYIDRNNTIQKEYAEDSYGIIPWEDRAYINWLNNVYKDDFDFDSETKTLTVKDAEDSNFSNIITNFVRTVFPTSYYELDAQSFKLYFNEQNEPCLYLIDKETTGVYEGMYWGREFVVTIKDKDTTTIEDIVAYPIKDENEPLRLALTDIKEKIQSSSYQTEVVPYVDGVSKGATSKTIVELPQVYTETGVVTGGVVKGGFYLDMNTDTLYEVTQEEVDGEMTGFPLPEEIDPMSFNPTFDFSGDIFNYLGETDGVKKYAVISGYKEVLDYVDYGISHSGNINNANGEEIYFYVENNKLSYIEYPGYYVNTDDKHSEATVRINYNFEDVSIPEGAFDGIVIDFEPFTGWDDSRFTFDFLTSDDTMFENPTYIYDYTIPELFESTLGASDAIPFFLEGFATSVMVEGFIAYATDDYINYTKDHVELSIELGAAADDTQLGKIETILTDAGYLYEYLEEEDVRIFMGGEEGEISIELFNDLDRGFLGITFYLPLGTHAN